MNPVNRVLGLVGLNIRRTSYGPKKSETPAEAEVLIRIGVRDLLISASNPLRDLYMSLPTYMAELGRVARAVHAKYPDMIAIDVGANVGDTAAIIRAACPAPIICIDGDRSQSRILGLNARSIGGVEVRYQYLSDKSRTETMSIEKAGWNSTLTPSAGPDASTVDFRTLDETLADQDRQRIRLIKVDTEGYDPIVLRGSRNLLEVSRPVVLFEHNRENLSAIGEDNLSVFMQLRDAGYYRALVWDAFGRFVLGTTLDALEVLEDLHGYVDFKRQHLSKARYLDVCVFHRDDMALGEECLLAERTERARGD